jgi:hypothetical protein
VIYETLEKYVEVRRRETGDNQSKAVAEAADQFGCSVETVWRALRKKCALLSRTAFRDNDHRKNEV